MVGDTGRERSDRLTNAFRIARFRVVIAACCLAAFGATAWALSTWRWWLAIEHCRRQNMKVYRVYVGPDWIPEFFRIPPFLFRTLGISCLQQELSDEDFRQIERIESVDVIWILDCNMSDVGVVSVSRLRGVTSIYLSHNKVTDVGVQYLVEMKELQHLGLEHNPITDAGLYELKSLRNLKCLRLAGTLVTTEAAHAFEKSTKIEELLLDEQ